jgi:hypothetical protein
VRYLSVKAGLRAIEAYRRICRKLDPYLGRLALDQIDGDAIWKICDGELKRGVKPATVNRSLAVLRGVLRMACYEWQWIDRIPKVKLLSGEVERDGGSRRTRRGLCWLCCRPTSSQLRDLRWLPAAGPERLPNWSGLGWILTGVPPGWTTRRMERREASH